MNQQPNRRSRQREDRTQNLPRPRKKRRAALIIPLAVLAAAMVLLVLVTPKQPQTRAYYTSGSESGVVEGTASHDRNYDGLRISEIMPSNHTAVPDENGAFGDWVEIWNSSDHPINLEGVGLSDRGDSIRFLFPAITLESEGRVIVFCDNTNQAERNRPLHAKFKLSSVGESVYLYDPSAFLIDSVTYHILGSDTSWALGEDGSFSEVSWYSPGYPNSVSGNEAYRQDTMVSDSAIIINEVMADAKSGLPDEDGEFSDWIELYNTTDQTISLDNFALSDKESKPLKWRFPDGAIIVPHGYYVVFCSGKDRRDDPTSVPHSNFRISAERDTVVLADSRGRILDRVAIDNLPEDASWAREPNGLFTVHSLATPGRDNSDITGADQDMRRRNKLGVYISEVMASNSATKVVDDTTFVDWVEIYNASADTVDLSGYGLSDHINRPRRWQFPAGTRIGPGEYKVILCDGGNSTSAASVLHTNYKVKRAGGETICLCDPAGRVLDKLVLPEIPSDISYGRTLGALGFFYYDAVTPGAQNAATGFRGYAEAPGFTTAPGLYYSTITTGIQVPEGCTVYYTTDGSIPTQQSTVYKGESIEMNFTGIIRARAYSDSGLDIRPSTILTGSYFINTYHTLPIVSLVCDPDVLWNPTDGMLVTGDNVVKEAGKLPFKNTIYREFGKSFYRDVHVEFYQLDGTQVLNQDAGFKLMGDYSLDMPQKSMKFRAKSVYGAKTFPAKLFDDRPYTEYKSFVLRNSGNDCMWTRLQDGFQSRMLDAYGTSIIHQAWNPVVVYINGVYWGHMNMRERVDRFFVAQHEGLDLSQADQMVILQGSGSLKFGTRSDRKEWQAFIAKVKKSNPAKNPEDLQYILDNVDVDNLFEYMALEMFVGNSDIGNTRFYRLKGADSKWRWIWYDADYGLYTSSFDSPKSYTKSSGMGQMKIDNTVFRALLSVPEYKDKFLTRLADVYKHFTSEFMLTLLDQLVEIIKPEMQLHWNRWGEENDKMVITEVPTTADGAYRYWESRVERLRNVCRKRPRLLWGYIKDAFSLSNSDMFMYFGPQPEFAEGAY